jgi:diguanylate cyclase (GGDEF)-like protein
VQEPVVRAVLQQWSVGVQLGVACLLALFFFALSRSVKLAEVRYWASAWICDAGALAAVMAASFLHPPPWGLRMSLAAYAAGKTAYVLFLVAGARHHVQPGVVVRLRAHVLVPILAVWSLSVGFFSPLVALAQMAQAMLVGSILVLGGAWVIRRPRTSRSRWLGLALWLQALVFLHYVPLLLPLVWGGEALDPGHLSVSSFLDAGAELVVALASLAALESHATLRLRQLNEELLESRETLRHLVDLDPLTGLWNRRRLRPFLTEARESGAALIFMDVDAFKNINDCHGHLVGDVCLRRVAQALRDAFRAEDGLFRWGGDEFLVVCPGLDAGGAEARMANVRRDLERESPDSPPCRLSVGVAMLASGGEPDAVLEEADRRMYAARVGPHGPP